MATTDSNDVGTGWSGATDKIFDFVLDYGRSKYIDVETQQSDNNIPDNADLQAGITAQTGSDATGGTFSSLNAKIGGLSIVQWVGVSVVGLLGAGIIKKLGLI